MTSALVTKTKNISTDAKFQHLSIGTMLVGGSRRRRDSRIPALALSFVLTILCQPCQGWSNSRVGLQNQETKTNIETGWMQSVSRRGVIASAPAVINTAVIASCLGSRPSFAEEPGVLSPPATAATATSDAKKLFNDARAYEAQGNVLAAQRLYSKVTKIEPRFVYGWSNLGNTQVALGALDPAMESYNTAIDLCKENLADGEKKLGVKRCDDLSILLLNRGCLRLNTGSIEEALGDLRQAADLRGRPDAVILQNLARAEELNGFYSQSDRNYNVAISMTSNEVNPFWLRSAMVKFQIGDIQGGFDLMKRVENRFPEAPEVRAAYAAFLAARGDQVAARQKYLEIPGGQRQKFLERDYLTGVVSWPPAMIDALAKVTAAAGDVRVTALAGDVRVTGAAGDVQVTAAAGDANPL